MLFTKIWVVFPAISMALRWDSVEFSANYFKERNVPYVCLISCGNSAWDVKFTKAASDRFISVSKLDVNNLTYDSIKRCFWQLFRTVGVLMDAECEAEEILNTASEKRWLDLAHIWLIIDETTDAYEYANATHGNVDDNIEASPRTLQTLSYLNISVDADIILASRYGSHFKLFDIFNFGKEQGGNMIVTELGTWKPEEKNTELIFELNKCKYYRRWNFRQSHMRIISVLGMSSGLLMKPEFQMFMRDLRKVKLLGKMKATAKSFDPNMLTSVNPVPGIVTITRTSTILLMEVALLHNIKFVHTRTDKWLGTYEQNASRAVATGIYFREQDLSSVFRYLDSLFERVTLIHPSLTSLETRYFYRIPTTGPGKFENEFLRPLSYGSWCCLLAVSLMCILIMVCTSRLEARPSAVQYALFSVIANVCQQCFEDDLYDMTVRRVSSARKVTMFVTGLACVLIYNYYTSSVVSYLLSGAPPTINSLEELLESPLEIIFEDVGYTHSWLTVPGYYFNKRNAKYEDIIKQRVLNKKRTIPLFVQPDQGVAMVKAGGYAYLTEEYSANHLISATFDQSELCELGSIPSIEKVLLYPGVQKDSPFKEFLTWSLTRMLERGIVSSVQRRTAPLPVACEGSSPRALALGGAAPAFIVLAVGYLVAAGIMIIERNVNEEEVGTQL